MPVSPASSAVDTSFVKSSVIFSSVEFSTALFVQERLLLFYLPQEYPLQAPQWEYPLQAPLWEYPLQAPLWEYPLQAPLWEYPLFLLPERNHIPLRKHLYLPLVRDSRM